MGEFYYPFFISSIPPFPASFRQLSHRLKMFFSQLETLIRNYDNKGIINRSKVQNEKSYIRSPVEPKFIVSPNKIPLPPPCSSMVSTWNLALLIYLAYLQLWATRFYSQMNMRKIIRLRIEYGALRHGQSSSWRLISLKPPKGAYGIRKQKIYDMLNFQAYPCLRGSGEGNLRLKIFKKSIRRLRMVCLSKNKLQVRAKTNCIVTT